MVFVIGLLFVLKHVLEVGTRRQLSVPANQLTSLPQSLGQLKGLRELNLVENRLTRLPVGDLSGLEKLYAGGNALTTWPQEIGGLKNLKHLKLFGNGIRELPSLQGLTALKSLDLQGNALTKLGDDLGELTHPQEAPTEW